MTLIANCCVKELPSENEEKRWVRYLSRRRLLHEIVGNLRDRDISVDAIVLPGGYFTQERFRYLKLNFEKRCSTLKKAPFANDVGNVVKELHDMRKGALLIFGVDTFGVKDPNGDQLCVAWSIKGPRGIARKVFPTKAEAEAGYVVNLDDFGSNQRVVEIDGIQTLLCACYDAFGIANKDVGYASDKFRLIKKIYYDGRTFCKESGEFRSFLDRGGNGWYELVEKSQAAAVAIHYFDKPGREIYWQKHGIASASAELDGGWIIAGANFNHVLPGKNDPNGILASFDVPREHLGQGNKRKAHKAEPIDKFMVGSDEARVCVFEFG